MKFFTGLVVPFLFVAPEGFSLAIAALHVGDPIRIAVLWVIVRFSLVNCRSCLTIRIIFAIFFKPCAAATRAGKCAIFSSASRLGCYVTGGQVGF